MVDLGNNVVNSVFEANVDLTIAKRPTPECQRSLQILCFFVYYNQIFISYNFKYQCLRVYVFWLNHCFRNIREAWIKAKYCDKAFITKLVTEDSSSGAAAGVGGNETPTSRRWSVQKRRRRSPCKEVKPDLNEGVSSGNFTCTLCFFLHWYGKILLCEV